MGAALGAADEVVVLDVYLAREDADPEVTGALVAGAVPLPPERVAFVPVVRRRRRRAGLARPARRPGADPGRRHRHRDRAPGPGAAGRCRPMRPRSPSATRRRFARRQWARRWLAWQLRPRRACCALVLVVGGVWLVFFSSFLSVKGVEVDGRAAAEGRRRSSAAAAVPEGEPLARVDLDRIRTRVEALAAVPLRRRDPAVARPGADRASTSARRSRSSRSAASCAGWTRRAWSSRTTPRRPPDLPRVQTGADTGSEALREGALVIGGAARGPGRAGRPRRGRHRRRDLAGAARRPRWSSGGARSESDVRRPTVLADLLAASEAQRYDVSVPGQPTTRELDSTTPARACRHGSGAARLPTVVTTARLT